MRYSVFFSIIVCLVTVSCGKQSGESQIGVPRRHAYHRIAVPDSIYKINESLPGHLQTSEAAQATLKRDDAAGSWVDVDYPGFNASIHYTFTPVTASTVAEVCDNRLERMSLNIGGNEAELTEFETSDGLTARVVVTLGGAGTTPVQFLATDNRSIVVSGAAYLPIDRQSARDSVAPVIDMLRRDVIHSLKTLSR